jgi:hypothetical protein
MLAVRVGFGYHYYNLPFVCHSSTRTYCIPALLGAISVCYGDSDIDNHLQLDGSGDFLIYLLVDRESLPM